MSVKEKGKSRKILGIILIIVTVILLVASVIGVITFDSFKRPLSKWKPESDDNNMYVEFQEYLLYDSQRVSYNDTIMEKTAPEGGSLVEVFCVEGDTMYYVYKKRDNNENKFNWVLASWNFNSEEFKILYVMKHDKSSVTYQKLSYVSDGEDICGGMYEGGKIYLKSESEVVAYDIKTQEINEHAELPMRRYIWEFSMEKDRAYVLDTEKGITKTISMETMAKQNSYANQLNELRKEKISAGRSNRIFKSIKCQDGQIYLILSLSNSNCLFYDFVFKYDFETEQILYLTYFKAWDYHNDYHFAPIDR